MTRTLEEIEEQVVADACGFDLPRVQPTREEFLTNACNHAESQLKELVVKIKTSTKGRSLAYCGAFFCLKIAGPLDLEPTARFNQVGSLGSGRNVRVIAGRVGLKRYLGRTRPLRQTTTL